MEDNIINIKLYEEIVLTRNFPQYQLKKGNIVTLIDFVSHPAGGEKGCVIEVFNAIGESLQVVTMPISAIERLTSQNILTTSNLKL